MNTENDTSKPETELKQEASEGCPGATCSPKVFIWAIPSHGDFIGYAIAEDGTGLAGHLSSSEGWVKSDMTNAHKREIYASHYPDGYEIEWVEYDDLETHEAFNAAFSLHEKISQENVESTREG